MNHVIIGTAGHVDHGKTSLIRALTSQDTDRLAEEKSRGITIELGFAYLPLPDGSKAGIIDVPGHERFIGNMLAGAGGIDLALLVVAADESVMPQTLEHLGILQLLGIRKGLIALTKTDLVDEEFLMLAEEDVRDQMRGTFLEDAPIFPVSSETGEGVDALRDALIEAVANAGNRKTDLPYRLPIDRVFTLGGFGTIVTGTLIEGMIRVGEDAMLYPEERRVRVRSLQVHDEPQTSAEAGQRLAVNLANVGKDDVDRGDILAEPGSLRSTMMMDVMLTALPHTHFGIEHDMRVHLHLGSSEHLARLVLLDRDVLEQGETCPAQLRLEESVYVRRGDRFVIRFYSPLETIGGGLIVDPCANKRKRGDGSGFDILAGDDETGRLAQILHNTGIRFESLDHVFYRAGLTQHRGDELLDQLEASGRAVRLDSQHALHRDGLAELGKRCVAILRRQHDARPLEAGMRRETLRTQLLAHLDIQLSDRVLNALCEAGIIEDRDGFMALPDFEPSLSPEQEQLVQTLTARFLEAGFTPPATDEILADYKKQPVDQILTYMITKNRLVRLTDQILMSREKVEEAWRIVHDAIETDGSITLADFRDTIGASRKYAVAILDYFDKLKRTKLEGDVRVFAR